MRIAGCAAIILRGRIRSIQTLALLVFGMVFPLFPSPELNPLQEIEI
jgi:hypothetical protein